MINKENTNKKIKNLLLNGKLSFDFNLASHTWLKTGGNAAKVLKAVLPIDEMVAPNMTCLETRDPTYDDHEYNVFAHSDIALRESTCFFCIS